MRWVPAACEQWLADGRHGSPIFVDASVVYVDATKDILLFSLMDRIKV